MPWEIALVTASVRRLLERKTEISQPPEVASVLLATLVDFQLHGDTPFLSSRRKAGVVDGLI